MKRQSGNKKMSIEVPDFKQFDDFALWVAELPEKEIRQWKTADWNNMFEKLMSYIEGSKEIEIARKIKNLTRIKNKYTKEDIFYNHENNLLAFAKLYKNFRFEPQQLKSIRNLAKQAGAQLAKDTRVRIERIATAPYSECKKDYEYIAQKISEIVLQQSDYPEDDKIEAEFKYDSKLKFGGDTFFPKNKNRKTQISYGYGEDFYIDMMMHECVHAYLQAGSERQKELLKQGKKPLKCLDDDFYKLLQYNSVFSLNFLDMSKIPEEYQAIFNVGYRKQPLEKFSYVYGIEAERAYRLNSGKNSERAAAMVAVLLSDFCGWPSAAEESDNAVVLKYKNKTPAEELLKRVHFIFDPIKKSNVEQAFNIHINKENELEMKIPHNYQIKDILAFYYQYISQRKDMSYKAYLNSNAANQKGNGL